MTKEEFNRFLKEKRAAIEAIQNEILEIKAQYCKENAPLKVGDRIRLKGKEGVISQVSIPWDTSFEYRWRPFKKDGSEGAEKTIWGFDEKNIEKL